MKGLLFCITLGLGIILGVLIMASYVSYQDYPHIEEEESYFECDLSKRCLTKKEVLEITDARFEARCEDADCYCD